MNLSRDEHDALGALMCEMDAAVEARMPKPYYEEDGITIYNTDCRLVLPMLRGSALITDPPFGIDWSRATWVDDSSNYGALINWLVSTSKNVIKDGWCFVFQAMRNCGRFHEWFPEGWRLFAACKNFAQIRPTGIWHSWDPVVFWQNGNAPGRTANVNRDYFVGNVAGVFGERIDHPCPKPIDTMRYIVSVATSADAVVIDPFMGSGTTLVAAKQLGRRAIGIEIERKYCDIAIERLRQTVLKFDEPAPEPQQMGFNEDFE